MRQNEELRFAALCNGRTTINKNQFENNGFDMRDGEIAYIRVCNLTLGNKLNFDLFVNSIIKQTDATEEDNNIAKKLKNSISLIDDFCNFIYVPEGDIVSIFASTITSVGSFITSLVNHESNNVSNIYMSVAIASVLLQSTYIMFQIIVAKKYRFIYTWRIYTIGQLAIIVFLIPRLLLAIALTIVVAFPVNNKTVEKMLPPALLTICINRFYEGVTKFCNMNKCLK